MPKLISVFSDVDKLTKLPILPIEEDDAIGIGTKRILHPIINPMPCTAEPAPAIPATADTDLPCTS